MSAKAIAETEEGIRLKRKASERFMRPVRRINDWMIHGYPDIRVSNANIHNEEMIYVPCRQPDRGYLNGTVWGSLPATTFNRQLFCRSRSILISGIWIDRAFTFAYISMWH